MKNIKNYINKIESLISTQLVKDQSKSKPKGLLSSTKDMSVKPDDKPNDLDIIARFVYGIRKAKKEVIDNGK